VILLHLYLNSILFHFIFRRNFLFLFRLSFTIRKIAFCVFKQLIKHPFLMKRRLRSVLVTWILRLFPTLRENFLYSLFLRFTYKCLTVQFAAFSSLWRNYFERSSRNEASWDVFINPDVKYMIDNIDETSIIISPLYDSHKIMYPKLKGCS